MDEIKDKELKKDFAALEEDSAIVELETPTNEQMSPLEIIEDPKTPEVVKTATKGILGFTLEEVKSLKLSIASPSRIEAWSSGKVTKPETINYKSFKPEADGLFCQKIFGPVKDYECACGKYKKLKNKDKVCEKCGVMVTESKSRRFKMGHIDLVEPIAHIWYFKTDKKYLSRILGVKPADLLLVIYLSSYIVISEGEVGEFIKKHDILDQEGFRKPFKAIIAWILENKVKEGTFAHDEATEFYGLISQNRPFNFSEVASFINEQTGAKFGTGSVAIKEVLQNIDLDKQIAEVEEAKAKLLATSTSASAHIEGMNLNKRLDILKAFKSSDTKLEWLVLDKLPVLPPDLRPLIELQGGKFTSSDVNDLYRSIIIRNQKLKEFLEKPYTEEIILNNARRLLQDAVDTLIDNGRRNRPKQSKDGKRDVKSLSQALIGKKGRFRQNLLGKRVDYSGRSVIIVGPELKMDECGLPVDMCLKLFEPFISHQLVKDDVVANAKAAQNLIATKDDQIWESVEKVLAERPVILNRAPSLHRLSMQAFYPKMIKGKAIRLHPLVTPAFNADFDGDQMAVHVPVTDEGVYEAKKLLLGSKNILGLKDGKPVVAPSQDMVLGNYYLTKVKKSSAEAPVKGEASVFKDPEEAERAYELGLVDLHAIVAIPTSYAPSKFKNTEGTEFEGGYIITTVGKAILNSRLPENLHWINEPTTIGITEGTTKYYVKRGENVREVIANIAINSDEWTNFVRPFRKGNISQVIFEVFTQVDEDPLLPVATSKMCDNIKDLGFRFATKSGVTVSMADMKFEGVDSMREKTIEKSDQTHNELSQAFNDGLLTEAGRISLVTGLWGKAKDEIQSELRDVLSDNKDNPIYMMSDSGARGNISNFTQLAGMRGIMSRARKVEGDYGVESVEMPVKSSFTKGLNSHEFFISTHGSRKSLMDTAFNTATSGYATRKFVDITQDIIIREEDCGSTKPYPLKAIVGKSGDIIIPLIDRLPGRTAFEDVKDNNGNIIVSGGEIITEKNAKTITENDIKVVNIRSIYDCKTEKGVCQKCFGNDLATHDVVKIGEPVGIIAAHSIGEPGTQLTMRTFHTGGVASSSDITQGLPAVIDMLDAVKVNQSKTSGDAFSLGAAKKSILQNADDVEAILETLKSDDKNYKAEFLPRQAKPFLKTKFKYLSKVDGTIESSSVEVINGIPCQVVVIAKDNYNEDGTEHAKHVVIIEKVFSAKGKNRIQERKINLTPGQKVVKGDMIYYPGQIAFSMRALLEISESKHTVWEYMQRELHAIYKTNAGITISDKYLEIILRKILDYKRVLTQGQSPFSDNSIVPRLTFEKENARLEKEGKVLAKAVDCIVGASQIPLNSDSFLVAASFASPVNSLTNAAIHNKVDYLVGITENNLIGRKIPVGTAVVGVDEEQLLRNTRHSHFEGLEKPIEEELLNESIENI